MEPLKFNALLKSTIWGGEKIIPFKHLDVQQENVGESWEISGVPGNETVVANGEYAGKKLNELVHELKGKLVGEANYQRFGDEFPLLIKFIDARQDLYTGASYRRNCKAPGQGARQDRDVVSAPVRR